MEKGRVPDTLYARILGPSWLELSDEIRAIHSIHPGASPVHASGRLRVTHGSNVTAQFLAQLFGLPRANDSAGTQLEITRLQDGERWSRRFVDQRFESRQYLAGPGELGERIGMLELRFRLTASNGALEFQPTRAALVLGFLRVPIPRMIAPRVNAREASAGAGRIYVHVAVSMPRIGRLLTYDGSVEFWTAE